MCGTESQPKQSRDLFIFQRHHGENWKIDTNKIFFFRISTHLKDTELVLLLEEILTFETLKLDIRRLSNKLFLLKFFQQFPFLLSEFSLIFTTTVRHHPEYEFNLHLFISEMIA